MWVMSLISEKGRGEAPHKNKCKYATKVNLNSRVHELRSYQRKVAVADKEIAKGKKVNNTESEREKCE